MRYEDNDRPLDLTFRQAPPPPRRSPWWLNVAKVMIALALTYTGLRVIFTLVEMWF